MLNVDETGWRTNGDKRYLWAFVAWLFVVYTVAASRGSEVSVRLLGAVFRGVLCSDRFGELCLPKMSSRSNGRRINNIQVLLEQRIGSEDHPM